MAGMAGEPPITTKDDGIVIKTEKLETGKIYACIYKEKVYLFFRDEHDLLNCYEVEDKETAEAIKTNPESEAIKTILEEAAKKQTGA